MIKQRITTIYEKNAIINRIINAIVQRKVFLVLGHKNIDEDCLASIVAVSILISRFDKVVYVYIDDSIPENIGYLINICKYNGIKIIKNESVPDDLVDTIIICDTPKRSMLNYNSKIKKFFDDPSIPKIEFDHHIASDGEYIGDPEYSLVTDASSTAQLIGFIALKLRKNEELLSRFQISDTLSRNFVLAVVTGIIGDTNMGQYIRSKKEKKYYDIFTRIYNDILMKLTVKETNFMKIDDVYQKLNKLTQDEEQCYRILIRKQHIKNSIGFIIINQSEMDDLLTRFEKEIVISATRTAANELAETSGQIGFIAFYDDAASDLIQFRMRRSHNFKEYDLRNVLAMFSISNGGGHEGAIAFRVPKTSIDNLDSYVANIIDHVSKKIDG